MARRPWQPMPRRGVVVLNLSRAILTEPLHSEVIEPAGDWDVATGFRDACREMRQMHRRDLIVVAPSDFYRSLSPADVHGAARALRSLPFDCRVHFSTSPDAAHRVARSVLPRRLLRFAPENRETGLGH